MWIVDIFWIIQIPSSDYLDLKKKYLDYNHVFNSGIFSHTAYEKIATFLSRNNVCASLA